MSSEAAAEQQLPSCIALRSKSNGKFLRYVHGHGEEKYRQLELSGEDALSLFTRFDVEPSRLHDGLVHIRCRYNRKYWVARRHDDDGWIVVAGADEPEEDLSKPSCTLIKAVPVVSSDDGGRARAAADAGDQPRDQSVTMTFRMVLAGRLQQAAAAGKDDDGSGRMSLSGTGTVGSCLCVGRQQQQQVDDDDDGFIIFNLSNSKRLLPRVVAFKGSNGKYLAARTIQGRNHLVFASDDVGDAAVAHEVVYVANDIHGRFRVRNRNLSRLWIRPLNMNWIILAAGAGSSNDDDLFELLQVGDDSFALRSTRTIFTPGGGPMAFSDNFCINQTSPAAALMNALEAASSTLPREALVKVEAAVMHREISDMVYFLDEARVYDRMPVTMAMADAVNDTSAPTTKRLTISFEETETTQWDATLELTLGYTATMKVGFPKLGLGAQAELSAEFFGSYNWGETVVTTVKKAVEYEVTVPPRTKVSVRVMATKATCDVPFGYIQKDTFTDGRVETRRKQDGIFTGVNSYNFQFHATEMPLEQRLIMQQHAS
ncbi:uncharacterized protein LOC100836324 [Brachypodium distachyon]|uniref:Agglutinin domain-containing protein n=1 Tax=Brachypodium distachyon TaxID=15368 RepID=A0A0Q3IW46_BRADI|nr:uncharacterized protein LOC100836324 [Brachypodium distachyon]KQK04700.1 hypothetical protein BRADI_2g15370v3 [Brachypodium distachyon]|eukprot:XP_003565852.1 uncharacterized protein LOC100836324 [Brachypodium distachyon]